MTEYDVLQKLIGMYILIQHPNPDEDKKRRLVPEFPEDGEILRIEDIVPGLDQDQDQEGEKEFLCSYYVLAMRRNGKKVVLRCSASVEGMQTWVCTSLILKKGLGMWEDAFKETE